MRLRVTRDRDAAMAVRKPVAGLLESRKSIGNIERVKDLRILNAALGEFIEQP